MSPWRSYGAQKDTGYARPNFLWIIAEDTGPWLGCYGEPLVKTPRLDALAARGIRFTKAWAGGAACSPSRSSLFSGMFSSALGTETHRGDRAVPPWAFFTPYLRQAGYFCTNNAKTDYNISNLTPEAWDANGDTAHYRDRQSGQPFFHCYSSLGESHMARIVNSPPEKRHPRRIDPKDVRLPSTLPDEPLLRDDRAWHLEGVEAMDAHVGLILDELTASGAAEDTIVFFFADHGGCLPNGKGYASDWGFHVPLLVYVPEKFTHLLLPDLKPGQASDRLVSFLDFAPTLFSLAYVSVPAYLQGKAFAGAQAPAVPQQFLYGFRGYNGGAQGGRWDVVRTIRDERFRYTRNFLPFRAPGLRQDYHGRMPGQQAWEMAWRAGRCDAVQSRFWQPKQVEELYDLENDPVQAHNLAADPIHADRLADFRRRLHEWIDDIQDIGFTPDPLRTPGAFPSYYDRMQAESELRRAILNQAWLVGSLDLTSVDQLAPGLQSPHPEVRYWAACGLVGLAYTKPGPALAAAALPLLNDPEPWVRVAAAEACVAAGEGTSGLDALWREVEANSPAAHEAFAAIETLGSHAAPLDAKLTALHARRSGDFRLNSALVTRGILPPDELFKGVTSP